MTEDLDMWEREMTQRPTFRALAFDQEHEALMRAAIELEA